MESSEDEEIYNFVIKDQKQRNEYVKLENHSKYVIDP